MKVWRVCAIPLLLCCFVTTCWSAARPATGFERLIELFREDQGQLCAAPYAPSEQERMWLRADELTSLFGATSLAYPTDLQDGTAIFFSETVLLDSCTWTVFYCQKRRAAWLNAREDHLAQVLGISPAELRASFEQLHTAANGTINYFEGTQCNPEGSLHEFQRGDIIARLYVPIKEGAGSPQARYELQYTEAGLRDVLAKTELYPELKQYGKRNQSATLEELIALAAKQGALGIIQRYDLSGMTFSEAYPDVTQQQQPKWKKGSSYIDWNPDETMDKGFYLAATDEGRMMQLYFTESWYDSANSQSIEQLNLEFDQLAAKNASGHCTVDAIPPEYDLDFNWCKVNDVLVTRKTYATPAKGTDRWWFSISTAVKDEDLSYYEQLTDPVWPLPDPNLPEPSPQPGALEKLARQVAVTPIAKLVTELKLTQNSEPTALRVYPRPFTAVYIYSRGGDTEHPEFATVGAYDDTFLQSVSVNPEWLAKTYGASQSDLDREIDALSQRFQITPQVKVDPTHGDSKRYVIPMGSVQIVALYWTRKDTAPEIDYWIQPVGQE